MKRSICLTLSATVAVLTMSISPSVLFAGAGLASGDFERGVVCKKLRRSGELRWYSIASGTVRSGGDRNGYSGFVTKACHTRESACRRWVKRVGYEISNLDTIRVAYCKRAR